MVIAMKDKRETISDMERVNTFTQMEVTTMEIGSRAKCKVWDNFLTVMEIWNMRGSGETITLKERVSSLIIVHLKVGTSMRVNSGRVIVKVLGSYSLEMVVVTRDSLEETIFGDREECLTRVDS